MNICAFPDQNSSYSQTVNLLALACTCPSHDGPGPHLLAVSIHPLPAPMMSNITTITWLKRRGGHVSAIGVQEIQNEKNRQQKAHLNVYKICKERVVEPLPCKNNHKEILIIPSTNLLVYLVCRVQTTTHPTCRPCKCTVWEAQDARPWRPNHHTPPYWPLRAAATICPWYAQGA